MAVVMGKEGPQGLRGGLGLGWWEAQSEGRDKRVSQDVPCVSFYPSLDQRAWQTLRKVAGLGWVGSDTGEGDECYRVIERESPKKALCLPIQDRRLGGSGGNVSQSSGGGGWRAGWLERSACSPSPPLPA